MKMGQTSAMNRSFKILSLSRSVLYSWDYQMKESKITEKFLTFSMSREMARYLVKRLAKWCKALDKMLLKKRLTLSSMKLTMIMTERSTLMSLLSSWLKRCIKMKKHKKSWSKYLWSLISTVTESFLHLICKLQWIL